ncbi:phosphate-regulating neutral endopeptidase PHEX-like [Haemaphysalis longicornis]
MLEKLRVPYEPEKHWILSGPVVNAVYDAFSNEVVFPAGVLHSVFYEPGLPQSINMGAFGSLVGHELTHGFDQEGSLHDAEGGPLWTNATREKFLEKSECFLQQYERVRDQQTGLQLNGRNTLQENIADNVGLRSAYRAYKNTLKEEFNDKDTRLRGLEELSGEKLFFIANAMVGCNLYRTEFLKYQIFYGPHSPSKYRINMPMMNMVEFSAAFNCPAHSTMNPDRSETCFLW